MHKLEQHIRAFFSNYPNNFIVACSGGVDSMVLLNLVYQHKPNLGVAHVNYGLRGEESDKDEHLIASFCHQNGIPLHLKRIDLKSILQTKGGNLQQTARIIRYDFFHELSITYKATILLAHHANDQIETFFLNLSRNSGIMGLSCMKIKQDFLMRPFLEIAKAELVNYALQKKITWREDQSNKMSYYNRNKFRNVILPELEQKIPTLNDSVLTLIKAFQHTRNSMDEKLLKLVHSIQQEGTLTFEQFDLLNDFEQRELLNLLKVSQTYFDEIVKLRKSSKSKKIILNNHCHYSAIINQGSHFLFIKMDEPPQLPEICVEDTNYLPDFFDKQVVYLNPDKIKGPLKIRFWESGDRMKTIGLKGSKLISDILKDAHVPEYKRKAVCIVEDDEKIVWCVGFAVGKEAIAESTTLILRVSVKNDNSIEQKGSNV